MSSVGNRRQIALTQVTPSAQVVIKAGFHAGHLRSSTITGEKPIVRFYPGFLSQPHQKMNLQNFFDQASTLARSTEIPGPIVEDTVTLFKNAPLEAAGFAFLRSVSNAARFSFKAGTSKSTRPIGQ